MNPKKILLLCLILCMSISVYGCTIYENNSSSDVISSVSETSDTQFQTEISSTVITITTVTTEPTIQAVESVDMDYIVNTNTGKFHYLYCSSINQMAEHNKMAYTGSRDDLIEQGYKPCKKCNP